MVRGVVVVVTTLKQLETKYIVIEQYNRCRDELDSINSEKNGTLRVELNIN